MDYRANDKTTHAVAAAYSKMLNEEQKNLAGRDLVVALTSITMSHWYGLTQKFAARPEVFDVHPEVRNDNYKVFKMSPGLDVRDQAYEAISSTTTKLAAALNKAFGKDVMEPSISRTGGSLETLVGFQGGKGGVFQCKSKSNEGEAIIFLTMPNEKEVERAFSAVTDTPVPSDVADGIPGDGPAEDEGLEVAGDAIPDYEEEPEMADDSIPGEEDMPELDAEPEEEESFVRKEAYNGAGKETFGFDVYNKDGSTAGRKTGLASAQEARREMAKVKRTLKPGQRLGSVSADPVVENVTADERMKAGRVILMARTGHTLEEALDKVSENDAEWERLSRVVWDIREGKMTKKKVKKLAKSPEGKEKLYKAGKSIEEKFESLEEMAGRIHPTQNPQRGYAGTSPRPSDKEWNAMSRRVHNLGMKYGILNDARQPWVAVRNFLDAHQGRHLRNIEMEYKVTGNKDGLDRHIVKELKAFMQDYDPKMFAESVSIFEGNGTDPIKLGSFITVQDEDDETYEFVIVTPEKANARRNWLSIDSKMAEAMLGKRPGTAVQLDAPGGPQTWRILSVTNPRMESTELSENEVNWNRFAKYQKQKNIDAGTITDGPAPKLPPVPDLDEFDKPCTIENCTNIPNADVFELIMYESFSNTYPNDPSDDFYRRMKPRLTRKVSEMDFWDMVNDYCSENFNDNFFGLFEQYGESVNENVSVGGSIAAGDSTANPETTKDAVHAREKDRKKKLRRRRMDETYRRRRPTIEHKPQGIVIVSEGANRQIVLHPEHLAKIERLLGDGDETTFKEETGAQVWARSWEGRIELFKEAASFGSSPIKVHPRDLFVRPIKDFMRDVSKPKGFTGGPFG